MRHAAQYQIQQKKHSSLLFLKYSQLRWWTGPILQLNASGHPGSKKGEILYYLYGQMLKQWLSGYYADSLCQEFCNVSCLAQRRFKQPSYHWSYHSSTWASAALMGKDVAFSPWMNTTKTHSGGLLVSPAGSHHLLFSLYWKSIHGRRPSYSFRQYTTGHTTPHLNQRQFRTNLRDVDIRKLQNPEETPTHTLLKEQIHARSQTWPH